MMGAHDGTGGNPPPFPGNDDPINLHGVMFVGSVQMPDLRDHMNQVLVVFDTRLASNRSWVMGEFLPEIIMMDNLWQVDVRENAETGVITTTILMPPVDMELYRRSEQAAWHQLDAFDHGAVVFDFLPSHLDCEYLADELAMYVLGDDLEEPID